MVKTPQFAHQKIGTAALVKNPAFALFDEMGAGKSKQVIDAACMLAEKGKIDTVVVVAPASVRCVWLDKEIGEIKKHSWLRNFVEEYHKKWKLIWEDPYEKPFANLEWVVTNYEFLRGERHLAELCVKLLDRKVLLVLDESSYIKNRTAAQTKAVKKLRQYCARCVLLNGTPVTNSPLDLWSQMQILSPDILEDYFKNFYNFRYSYCTMKTMRFGESRSFQKVVDYKNLDELAQRIAPYVLRREKKDCLDLPPKLYTEREVALSAESWKRYQELKRDCLLTLSKDDVRIEPNAAVRLMRLAQLTNGILGSSSLNQMVYPDQIGTKHPDIVTQDISDEKLRWAVEYLTEECTAKAVIVWCRWRRERERLFEALQPSKIILEISQLYGGQKTAERNNAVMAFSNPRHLNDKRAILIAQHHAGSHGLNLIAATEHIFLSNDFSLGMRLQAEDRSHRPGQKNNITYIDVIATGPNGQKTIDRTIFDALRAKKNVADLTCAEWRKSLEEE